MSEVFGQARGVVKLTLDNSLLIDTPADWLTLTIDQLFKKEDVFGRFIIRLNNKLKPYHVSFSVDIDDMQDLTFGQFVEAVGLAINRRSKEVNEQREAERGLQGETEDQVEQESQVHHEYSGEISAASEPPQMGTRSRGYNTPYTANLKLGVASVVQIFFATDRASEDYVDASFNSDRAENGGLSLGACYVSIPKRHKLGMLESPSILRLEFSTDPEKHITLIGTKLLEPSKCYEQITESFAASSARDLLVFVHGYNVTFKDAARRTAQIAFDLRFQGAPVFYSWPSRGELSGYMHDETNAEWTIPHFRTFLENLTDKTHPQKIHIIAHSMGNRVVCRALRDLQTGPLAKRIPLVHLILAAADLDADTFREMASDIQAAAEQVTLYQSSKDKALLTSRKLHDNPRAGEPILVMRGMDAIDASGVDTDFLGHGYFSDNWPLLSDINYILRDNKRPGERFGLEQRQYNGLEYFAFVP